MSDSSFRLMVHVQPRARREGLVRLEEGVLRVRVAALAIQGKANDALVGLLARALGVPRGDVRIVRGHGGRRKLVEVAGLTAEEGERRLLRALREGAV